MKHPLLFNNINEKVVILLWIIFGLLSESGHCMWYRSGGKVWTIGLLLFASNQACYLTNNMKVLYVLCKDPQLMADVESQP